MSAKCLKSETQPCFNPQKLLIGLFASASHACLLVLCLLPLCILMQWSLCSEAAKVV